MQKGRVSADESQGRIRVGGPNQEDVLAAQARHGLSSLLPAAGCSVSPRLQSPAAAGRDAGWFFQENSRKNSGRYLKAQHPVCTNRMNSDCPRQPEPCAGSFLLRVWQRLKEGATGTPKPQQPVLPNTKQRSRREGWWFRGHSRARLPGRGAGQTPGRSDPKRTSGVNHLSSLTEGSKKMGEWGERITQRGCKTLQLLREASFATRNLRYRKRQTYVSFGQQNKAVFLDSSKVLPIRTKNTNIRNHVSFTKKYHMYNSNNSRQQNTQKFKLYKYHAEQTNYKTEKEIKLVDSTSLTCLIFLE